MSAVRTPWTRQPQVAVRPNASSGVPWAVLWNAATPTINLASNQTKTPIGLGSVGLGGKWQDFKTATAVQSFDCRLPTTAYTFVAEFVFNEANRTTASLIRTTGGGVRIEPYTSGGGWYISTTHNGVATGPSAIASASSFSTTPAVLVLTYDGAISTLLVKWPDGTVSTNSVTLGISAGSGAIDISTAAGSLGAYMLAYAPVCATSAYARDVLNNPWQLFAPLPRRIWAPTAASGNAAVTLAGASAASAAGAITVSAAAVVAISGASATSAAGSASATGGAVVSVVGAFAASAPGLITAVGGAVASVIGASATASAGAVTASASAVVMLAGSAAASSAGAVSATATATVALSGAAAVAAAGAITIQVSGSAVVTLAGAGSISAAGQASAVGGASAPLTGAAAVVAAGSITVSFGVSAIATMQGAQAVSGAGIASAVGSSAATFAALEIPAGPFYSGISTGKGQPVPISAGPLILPPAEGPAAPTTREAAAGFFALLKALPVRDSDAVV